MPPSIIGRYAGFDYLQENLRLNYDTRGNHYTFCVTDENGDVSMFEVPTARMRDLIAAMTEMADAVESNMAAFLAERDLPQAE